MYRFPVYQSYGPLLDDFRLRLLSFVKTQTMYLSHKVVQLEGLAKLQEPTVFAFDGEYSIVSEPTGGDVTTHIDDLQQKISKALGVIFMLVKFSILSRI